MDLKSKPYYVKLIMRFGDSDTQLGLLVYPGGKSESVYCRLDKTNKGDLEQLISKMLAENPDLKAEDIAAKVKVMTTRRAIDHKAVERAVADLKVIRMSPFLRTRVCVDECPQFDYWFDDGQESVRYTILGEGGKDPQDMLVQWMLKFRAQFADVSDSSSVLKH